MLASLLYSIARLLLDLLSVRDWELAELQAEFKRAVYPVGGTSRRTPEWIYAGAKSNLRSNRPRFDQGRRAKP